MTHATAARAHMALPISRAKVGFALPILSEFESGEKVVQQIDPDGNVVGFAKCGSHPNGRQVDGNIIARVNHPQVFAFLGPNDVTIVGPLASISDKLREVQAECDASVGLQIAELIGTDEEKHIARLEVMDLIRRRNGDEGAERFYYGSALKEAIWCTLGSVLPNEDASTRLKIFRGLDVSRLQNGDFKIYFRYHSDIVPKVAVAEMESRINASFGRTAVTPRSAEGVAQRQRVGKGRGRWAPVVDTTLDRFFRAAENHAIEFINQRFGTVLHVGLGSWGLLSKYSAHLAIVGVDSSSVAPDSAEEKLAGQKTSNVIGLYREDADALSFSTGTFDTVVAMYLMTVVPDPEKVMHELARVCKVGGEVILVNHFSQEEGVRGWVERRLAPFADKLGWRPVFDVARVMGCDNLALVGRRALPPWGLFTMLRFEKIREAVA